MWYVVKINYWKQTPQFKDIIKYFKEVNKKVIITQVIILTILISPIDPRYYGKA